MAMQHGWPALYTRLLWWFSTGVILYLNGLPRATHPWTMAAATVNRVVAFLTSPRPREVLGELGEAQVDGVTWATRTPADDPDDLACALSELARFGVVPDWSELVDDGDLVAAP